MRNTAVWPESRPPPCFYSSRASWPTHDHSTCSCRRWVLWRLHMLHSVLPCYPMCPYPPVDKYARRRSVKGKCGPVKGVCRAECSTLKPSSLASVEVYFCWKNCRLSKGVKIPSPDMRHLRRRASHPGKYRNSQHSQQHPSEIQVHVVLCDRPVGPFGPSHEQAGVFVTYVT